VADGHPAGQAEGAGALQDQVDGEGAQLATVVQVDVEAAAVPAGDGEDGVPGRTSRPLWEKATSSIVTRSAKASRAP
jgi:hypothetical protein